MGHYRRERIASNVREIVSDAIAHKINDPRVDSMTTVTRVVMSGDILIANVYLSVRGGPTAERKTLGAIRHARGFIQRLVARQLTVRQCPELRFEIDEAAKGLRETMELLAENRRNETAAPAPDDDGRGAASESPDQGEKDEADAS